ncbi:carbohydrate ABC transporter permease [Deinococcus sp. KSM4-11]|uniref:carbohydrate ABC transporter permease n=1 Tax=Deinococcus sp. KSM4-11 TaxID=2568654 RepID=UPI0010A35391|nr:carbohydrate ABC transporter permease [Deinococcus sp. KSM4-11]THF88040.1 carbohydrate ABC transporter permease [Deinococcus sp. KSM4-11]
MTRSRWWRVGYSKTFFSVIFLMLFLFPLYWMVVTALRPQSEIFAYPPHFLPLVLDWGYFRSVTLDNPQLLRYFGNSLVVGTGTTLLTLALSAPAAFALAHLPLKGKGVLLLLSLSSLMFPVIMLATPMFVIFNKLGLTNNLFGLILANTTITLPFAMTVLRPFFLGISRQLLEAALIDGTSVFGAFLYVILPLTLPGLLTTAIFTFLSSWGDLLLAVTLTTQDNYKPITAGIYSYIGSNIIRWNLVMSLATIAMLPPMLITLILQRYVVAGLTAGAVKE